MTTITLRMEDTLKKDIQKIAEYLGVSLNQLINLKLKELTQNDEIVIPLKNKWNLGFDNFSFEEGESLVSKSNGNSTKVFNMLDSQLGS